MTLLLGPIVYYAQFLSIMLLSSAQNLIHYAIANDHYVIELTVTSISAAIFNIVTDVPQL